MFRVTRAVAEPDPCLANYVRDTQKTPATSSSSTFHPSNRKNGARWGPRFIFLFGFMSLGYELVVFASSCKFIKFILVWHICNRANFEFFKELIPLPASRLDSRF
jgi:hypothetical protein